MQGLCESKIPVLNVTILEIFAFKGQNHTFGTAIFAAGKCKMVVSLQIDSLKNNIFLRIRC